MPDIGHRFYFGFNDVRLGLKELEGVNFRFTCGVDRSTGVFFYRSGGLGGGSITNAKTQKTVITIGVYPFNFKFFKHLELNIGVKYLRTFSSNASGSSSDFGLAGNDVRDIGDVEGGVFSKNQIGATGRVACQIKLTDNLSLTPQYSYYISLSKEFRRYISTTSIQNHFLGIGIQKGI
jgi:hypothetical protein